VASTRELAALLERNRLAAARLAVDGGRRESLRLLGAAARRLRERVRRAEGLGGPGKGSFTAVQARALLAQVRLTIRQLQVEMRDSILERSGEASATAAKHTVGYLRAADSVFRGVGESPLALDEARMFSRAAKGARASVLGRIAAGGLGETGSGAQKGVLARYGHNVIRGFERKLQVAMVAKTPWHEVRKDIVEESSFLKTAPLHWAERIVRTEVLGSYGRGAQEVAEEAAEQLTDVVKILCATFDSRTSADSFSQHGMVRRPNEPFEWWEGLYMNPPNRPNDREILVVHRLGWPVPPNLHPKSAAEIAAAWRRDGRKGSPPPRPKMSTVLGIGFQDE
jgi:hypothetical protein